MCHVSESWVKVCCQVVTMVVVVVVVVVVSTRLAWRRPPVHRARWARARAEAGA